MAGWRQVQERLSTMITFWGERKVFRKGVLEGLRHAMANSGALLQPAQPAQPQVGQPGMTALPEMCSALPLPAWSICSIQTAGAAGGKGLAELHVSHPCTSDACVAVLSAAATALVFAHAGLWLRSQACWDNCPNCSCQGPDLCEQHDRSCLHHPSGALGPVSNVKVQLLPGSEQPDVQDGYGGQPSTSYPQAAPYDPQQGGPYVSQPDASYGQAYPQQQAQPMYSGQPGSMPPQGEDPGHMLFTSGLGLSCCLAAPCSSDVLAAALGAFSSQKSM